MKNWKQILGLSCKHTRLSWPVGDTRHCVSCGAVFPFTAWQVNTSERNTIAHYETRGSIKRVGHGLLRFRQRKEGQR